MKKNILLISILFTCTIFCTTIFAQAPANDECGGAIAVTTNPFGTTCTTLTAGTTNNATASPFVSTCAAGFADDDVWYSFVANSQ